MTKAKNPPRIRIPSRLLRSGSSWRANTTYFDSFGSMLIAKRRTPFCRTRSMTSTTFPWAVDLSAAMIAWALSSVFEISRQRAAMASAVDGSPFRKSFPSLVTMTDSVVSIVSPPVAAFGRSTSILGLTMYADATMKMINSTNMTSTRGVTLMSVMPSSSSRFAPPAI